jgi:hypothetical protein
MEMEGMARGQEEGASMAKFMNAMAYTLSV